MGNFEREGRFLIASCPAILLSEETETLECTHTSLIKCPSIGDLVSRKDKSVHRSRNLLQEDLGPRSECDISLQVLNIFCRCATVS